MPIQVTNPMPIQVTNPMPIQVTKHLWVAGEGKGEGRRAAFLAAEEEDGW
jgi:hypothetical protein